MTTQIELKRETVTAPPKHWRNMWRAKITGIHVGTITGTRTHRTKGDVYLGRVIWPSREIAEQQAIKLINNKGALKTPDYLGPVACDAEGNPL